MRRFVAHIKWLYIPHREWDLLNMTSFFEFPFCVIALS
jgi:hypothetical protein